MIGLLVRPKEEIELMRYETVCIRWADDTMTAEDRIRAIRQEPGALAIIGSIRGVQQSNITEMIKI
jgi:hypothetical protein